MVSNSACAKSRRRDETQRHEGLVEEEGCYRKTGAVTGGVERIWSEG